MAAAWVRAPRRLGAAVAAVLLALGLTAGLTACGGGGKPEIVPSAVGVEPVVTVHVIDNRYEPASVEIEVGQAVRWVFEGSMEHDVVADDGSFVSELVTAGEYVHVFEAAGEWAYDCSIHPEMTGVVTVR